MRYEKKTRSPYHKYDKKPHRYSEAYNRWRANLDKFGLFDPATVEADLAFRRLYNIPLPRLNAYSRGFGR